MMEKITVVVKKAKKPTWWYSGLVGTELEVYDNRRDYILAEDYDRGHNAMWRHLDKDDCEPLNDKDD